MAAQLGGQRHRAAGGCDQRIRPDGGVGAVLPRCGGDGHRYRGPHRRHPHGDRRLPASDDRGTGDGDRRGRAGTRGLRFRRRLDARTRRPGDRDCRPGDPIPRRHEHPRRDVGGAAGRPRRHHRSARGPVGGVHGRAPAGRADPQGPHPRRLPQRHQGLRRGILRAVEDGGRQHRSAAADGSRIDLGGFGKRPHPGVQPARRERRRLRRQLHQRLQLPGDDGPAHRAPVRHHRHREFDHRQPGVLLLRLPRPVGGRRHRLLVVPGGGASGRAGAALG